MIIALETPSRYSESCIFREATKNQDTPLEAGVESASLQEWLEGCTRNVLQWLQTANDMGGLGIDEVCGSRKACRGYLRRRQSTLIELGDIDRRLVYIWP